MKPPFDPKAHSEKVKAGHARVAAMGGRPPGGVFRVHDEQIRSVDHLSLSEGAKAVGLCRSQFSARRQRLRRQSSQSA